MTNKGMEHCLESALSAINIPSPATNYINGLTIKTDSTAKIDSSPYSSPSLISPPSSAFVSALQSPYISPRASTPAPPSHPSPPISFCGSLSEDIPSSSYTPPPERSDFSDDQKEGPLKIVTCVPAPDAAPPRISFSFPVPRISFAKTAVSPAVNAKLRSCDVYIGYHGSGSGSILRFCKWLKSELELQGIACFLADRARYADSQSHEIADRVICSVTFGIVVISSASFLNHFSLEEIRFFSQKKNLIPMFFDTNANEITTLLQRSSDDKERKEAIDGLLKSNELKLEASNDDWRFCISKAASVLRAKLGRVSVAEKELLQRTEELPFPRNCDFVGREEEMIEIESALFGSLNSFDQDWVPKTRGSNSGQSDGFADEESEPAVKKRPKYKKSKSTGNGNGSSVVCISGPTGAGKTDLALEFAYRNSQKYRTVLWVDGEAQHLRQNLLNLSLSLGLDVSPDPEKERGRIRSFDEQEYEAFKRIKRELFRDMPYLLIIDNLESENEWWEGKDLHDLIPRNTGGSHVIITTRLSKVMNFDSLHLQPLSIPNAMALLKRRRKIDYTPEENESLQKITEKLQRSAFGLSMAGSLLSELEISPSALYQAVSHVPVESSTEDSFLVKLCGFCFAVLEKSRQKQDCLASRMLLVGAWFAPAPISANLLSIAAKNIPADRRRFKKWTECVQFTLGCCLTSQGRKSEEDSALLLIRFGLGRKSTRLPGLWIQFHPITQSFFRRTPQFSVSAKASVLSVRKLENPVLNSDHLWSSAFLVFGYKSEAPVVQLKATEMVMFIKKTALPLAIKAFTTFSRCNSALELLKVCANVLEEVEKSFVSQIQDWCQGSLCWKKRLQRAQRVDEDVWREVTLLKATVLETRAKLLLRGGHFDSAEELCRTCISIRTVMLGHKHAQTLAAQETLAKLVRLRSKM